MSETSREEQSCSKLYSWMIPREFGSTLQRYFEKKSSHTMADSSSHSTTKKWVETTTYMRKESVTMISRQNQAGMYAVDKENRVRKDFDGGSVGVVKSIKMRYEELSHSRKYVGVRESQSVSNKGAIKKSIVVEEQIEIREEKIMIATTKKRAAICVDDDFGKSRFTIYADKKPKLSKDAIVKKPEKTADNCLAKTTIVRPQQRPQNRNLTKLQLSAETGANTLQARSTPIDVPAVPLIPKKVKIQHRQSSKNATEEPNSKSLSICRTLNYKLPYDDEFIKFEAEKERPRSRGARGFRQQNITVEQRKIIVKFLIRINAHSFYPSHLLYQTVKIFDAVLDAKRIGVEELQLTALASMWIALKREHNVHCEPSAETMLSLANGLYAGRTDLLRKSEREILQSLNYEIVFPDPFSILCYDITKCSYSHFLGERQIELAYYCGGYMIDLALFDEELMNISAILLAAAAAETALFFVLEEVKSGIEPFWFKWRTGHTAAKYTEDEISRVRSALIEKIAESSCRHTDGEFVFKKYSRSRYGKISHFLGTKVRLFLATESSINLDV